jgi:hypothetical protein
LAQDAAAACQSGFDVAGMGLLAAGADAVGRIGPSTEAPAKWAKL